MVHRSLDNLRFDRRLLSRRGWSSAEELGKELEALPDVSHKVRPPEEDSPEGDLAGEAPGTGEDLPAPPSDAAA